MCGICGIANGAPRPPDPAIVQRMMQRIAHRGPDDAQHHTEPGVALGFRRLSIIDLHGSRQPLSNEAGTIHLLCNGEIYNYRELRTQLEACGHRFATDGDAETVVHAYEEWGTDCFAKLRGMFAIAIWDRLSQSLILARDRFGIKPLFYAEHAGSLLFGSELKALVSSNQLPLEIDYDAVALFLSLMYIPAPHTIYRTTRKLPPASMLTFRNGSTQLERYWTPPEPDATLSLQDATEQLRTTLDESVRLHLQSDVPVAFFLSGGMDSSALVALAAQHAAAPLTTFSIGFDQKSHDELDYARIVAKTFGCDHHEAIVAHDAAGVLPDIVSHFDEPFGDSSAIPTYQICKAAANHARVVVGGDGGDEMFIGYDWTRRQRFVERLQRVPRHLRHALWSAAEPLAGRPTRAGKLARFLGDAQTSPLNGYLRRASSLGTIPPAALFGPLLQNAHAQQTTHHTFSPFFSHPDLDPVDAMNRADLGIYLPDDDLCKVDRMTMRFSLEGRVPLLDNAVADLALSLPADMKLHGTTTKFVFKQAVRDLLPPGVRRQRKQGFAIPVASWMRGELHHTARRLLLSPEATSRGITNPATVTALLDAHAAGTGDHGHLLYSLLVLEVWFRLHVDTTPASAFGLTLDEI